MTLTENDIEQATLEWLSDLGWGVAHGPDLAPEGKAPERASYGDVLLLGRFKNALAVINPQLPPEALDDVVRKVVGVEMPSLVEENRRLHRLMVDGVAVQYMQADGTIKNDIAWIIDWANQKNDWLAVNQFTIIEERNNRRPDILLFVNGLPLGVIELKNAGDENATIDGAFRQTQAYKQLITTLFRTNAIILITAAQLLEELISIAKDIKADRERGEEQGLSEEEIAFYDALAENESAIELLGDAKLRVIATELVLSVRNNVSVDWMHRDSARAKLRIEVKKILKKYGYPPDLQDAAVQLVLQQAEVLAPLWVS